MGAHGGMTALVNGVDDSGVVTRMNLSSLVSRQGSATRMKKK